MPNDIPFYMLSNKAKRKRIELEECDSTDSLNDNAIDRRYIIEQYNESDKYSELFKYPEHILYENINLDQSPQDSQLPLNSLSSSQSSEKSVFSKLILQFLRAGLKENHECFADDKSEPRFPTSAQTLLQTEIKLMKKIVEPGYYILSRVTSFLSQRGQSRSKRPSADKRSVRRRDTRGSREEGSRFLGRIPARDGVVSLRYCFWAPGTGPAVPILSTKQ
ncbi:hypothetical protein PUN28_009769 [Cardiocondyla obscurior]|uniref:Uncharacterized protein n=1 Tax=Cardiocondyla obscurior TaxID=286306 RepID=A0AAW2FMD7_9HYME